MKRSRDGRQRIAKFLLSVIGISGGGCSGLSPSVVISDSGTTANYTKIVYALSWGDYLENEAFQIAQDVWRIASDHPDVKWITVKMVMSKDNMSDGYGKAWKYDMKMGDITITNLDEVRKYADDGSYAISDHVKMAYLVQLRRLDFHWLLRGGKAPPGWFRDHQPKEIIDTN
jgi:hypothetical protein